MELRLKGKTALVAAASSGLGRAVAEGLGAEGVRVMLCARSEEKLREAAAEVERAGGEAAVAVCDLTDADSIEQLLNTTQDRFGDVDILVTNAGGPPPGLFDQVSDEAWMTALDSMLLSVIRLVRGTVPSMKKKGWGRIISLTSISVRQPLENLLLSNTVRPGIVGLMKSLVMEFAPHGVTWNCVAPGYTRTSRLEELVAHKAEAGGVTMEDVFRSLESGIPTGRVGDPAELADLVVFLSSERAAYLNGLTIPFDGGFYRGLM